MTPANQLAPGLGSIIIIAFFIGLFLLFREFWCWYWKINERTHLLREILIRLKELPPGHVPDFKFSSTPSGVTGSQESSSGLSQGSPKIPAGAPMWVCSCGSMNSSSNRKCPECGFTVG